MRKPLIIANWKMFKSRDESLDFIYTVNMEAPKKESVDMIVCPQAPILRSLIRRQGPHIRIAAQNVHEEENGAYTGEISAALLADLGVHAVIVGHSERRRHYNETDERVNLKIKQAVTHGLVPIACLGEPLDIRESGDTIPYVRAQVERMFSGLTPDIVEKTIIAYEPIWAIGTGRHARAKDAAEAIDAIRDVLTETVGIDASVVRIVYGGSVNPDNIDEYMAEETIDGALVGGASLEAKSYMKLVESAESHKRR